MPTPSGRRKPGPRRAARSRKPKRSRAARWWPLLRLLWELVPLVLLLFVVLAAFVLDPAAVARLVWVCMSGSFGTGVQVAVSAAVVAGTAAIAWAFWPEAPAAKPGRTRSGTRARPRRSATDKAAAAGSRTRRNRADPVTAQEAPPDPAPSADVAHGTANREPATPTVAPARRQPSRRKSRAAGRRANAGSNPQLAEQPGGD